MRAFIITILALASVVGVRAQSAKVAQLSDKDAAEIKALYAQQEVIQKKIDAFKEHVSEAYVTAPKTGNYCPSTATSVTNLMDGSSRCVKAGWSLGFSYSDDFKYIVPVTTPEYKSPLSFGGGCAYVNPVIGTSIAQ